MGILWKLVKWCWDTAVKALQALLIAGIIAGVGLAVFKSRDRLMELWHRVVS